MSAQEFVAGLTKEAAETMERLLRQAYDRGFREALAAAGGPGPTPGEAEASAAAIPLPVPAAAAEPPPGAPVAWTSAPPVGDLEPEEDEDDDEDSGPDETVVRPIPPHATVGTLRRRIVRTFALERFEIDVIICRRGDRDRRQLQNRVRLSKYAREEA